MQHTPGGWPYLGLGDYVDETPNYTLETANKLEQVVGPAPGTIIDSGWVNVTLASGITGDLAYRILNGVVHWSGSVTRTAGAFPTTWTTIVTAGNLPAAVVPEKTGQYPVVGRTPSAGLTADVYSSSGLRVSAWGSGGPSQAVFNGLVWVR